MSHCQLSFNVVFNYPLKTPNSELCGESPWYRSINSGIRVGESGGNDKHLENFEVPFLGILVCVYDSRPVMLQSSVVPLRNQNT